MRAPVWPGLFAALLLVLQTLIPGAAVSHNASGAFVICTAQGAKIAASGQAPDHKHKGFGGLACEQCVMASLAAVAATPPYEPAPDVHVIDACAPAAAASPPPPSRAPPRPFSQGPPLLS